MCSRVLDCRLLEQWAGAAIGAIHADVLGTVIWGSVAVDHVAMSAVAAGNVAANAAVYIHSVCLLWKFKWKIKKSIVMLVPS